MGNKILSSEMKQHLSNKRKEWLRNNPEKHPWRKKDKFISIPCEKAKEFLKSHQVLFIEEFIPHIEGHNFSIDIALPDKLIAIEINGNQHYDNSGNLKKYYQERHDLLENNGWTVYEIHYSSCFNLEKWTDFILKLKHSSSKISFDYFNYKPRQYKKCSICKIKNIRNHCKRCSACVQLSKQTRIQKQAKKQEEYLKQSLERSAIIKEKRICKCGRPKSIQGQSCHTCFGKKSQKCIRPSKEELEQLIWKYPMTTLGKHYNVSDNAIRKWCKQAGISTFPNNKYWRTRHVVDHEGVEPSPKR